MPSRSTVVPQEPRSSKRRVASAAPNWSEVQDPRIIRTGVLVERREVVTDPACRTHEHPVQRDFPSYSVKQDFTVDGSCRC
ncbi:hypothetical protein GCM10009793_03640 [Brachybacterium phenoliresistens]